LKPRRQTGSPQQLADIGLKRVTIGVLEIGNVDEIVEQSAEGAFQQIVRNGADDSLGKVGIDGNQWLGDKRIPSIGPMGIVTLQCPKLPFEIGDWDREAVKKRLQAVRRYADDGVVLPGGKTPFAVEMARDGCT